MYSSYDCLSGEFAGPISANMGVTDYRTTGPLVELREAANGDHYRLSAHGKTSIVIHEIFDDRKLHTTRIDKSEGAALKTIYDPNDPDDESDDRITILRAGWSGTQGYISKYEVVSTHQAVEGLVDTAWEEADRLLLETEVLLGQHGLDSLGR